LELTCDLGYAVSLGQYWKYQGLVVLGHVHVHDQVVEPDRAALAVGDDHVHALAVVERGLAVGIVAAKAVGIVAAEAVGIVAAAVGVEQALVAVVGYKAAGVVVEEADVHDPGHTVVVAM